MLTLLLGVWLVFAPQNTTILQGTVQRAGASDPIAGVEITLSLNTPQSSRVRTISDAQGRFTFENVPLGRYTLQANREGYFTSPAGHPLPFPVATLTIDSLQTQRIVIELVPGATIAGRITGPDGNPLAGVKLSATTLQYDAGRRTFALGSLPKATDDRGDYRIYWLPPGEYYIRAEYENTSSSLARRSYYPGTLDSTSAIPLTIRGGETLEGMNFALPRANTIRISGHVNVNNAPYPSGGIVRTFYLLPRDGRPIELYPAEFANTVRPQLGAVSLDFAIEARGVAPGSYDLAPFYIDGTTFYTGRTRIDIGDTDLEKVTAHVTPNIEVTGRVSVKDNLAYDKWRPIQIQLRSRDVPVPLTVRSGTAVFQPDGTFSIRDVVEGRYQLYLGATPGTIPGDLYISGIRQGGADLQDEGTLEVRPGMQPVEITLSTGAGKIEGSVESALGGVPARADVVLVPPLHRRKNVMYYDRATIDANGRFSFSGIAPGEYKVFAFEQLSDGAELNPEFIARYETLGLGVTVTASTTREIRLRLLR
jgi:hypothetical protein